MAAAHRGSKRPSHRPPGNPGARVLVLGTLGVVLIVALFVFGYLQQPSPDAGDADPFRLEDQPALGRPDAPVTLVEFGDFKCPYCALFAHEIFPTLKREYIDTGKVRFHFVNFAFIGPDSTTAAVIGEAVHDQDPAAFWSYYEAVYAHQGPEDREWATVPFLLQLAREAAPDIDQQALAGAVDDPAYGRRVEEDNRIARASGVRGVPALFVNGEPVEDWSLDGLRRAIDDALAGGTD